MIMEFVRKLKTVSPQILFLHFWAKLILGIGIGLVAAKYLAGDYGWWLIVFGLLISLPGVYCALKG